MYWSVPTRSLIGFWPSPAPFCLLHRPSIDLPICPGLPPPQERMISVLVVIEVVASVEIQSPRLSAQGWKTSTTAWMGHEERLAEQIWALAEEGVDAREEEAPV